MADIGFVVLAVRSIDLGCDLQRDARLPGDFDRAVKPLFRRDAPDEGEVASRLFVEPIEVAGDAVIDRCGPSRPGQWLPLGVRHGDDRDLGEFGVQCPEFGQVEPTVQRRHVGSRKPADKREMQVIRVPVHDIELVRARGHGVQHEHVGSHPVDDALVEPERTWPRRNEPCRRAGIPAGEQRHVVTHPDKRLGEVGHNSLRPSVPCRGHAFGQRCDLCNPHRCWTNSSFPDIKACGRSGVQLPASREGQLATREWL